MNEKQQPYNGQIDEALLTAYALEQLEGSERALVEAALKTDHKAQDAVEEIRQVAGHLRDAVSHDEDYAPSATLREMIEQRLEGMTPSVVKEDGGRFDSHPNESGTGPVRRSRRRWAVFAVASAAVLLLAVTIPSLPMFQHGTTSDLAMEMAPTFKAEAPAAEDLASAEAAREEMVVGERGESAVGVEAKQLASEPLEEAPASAAAEFADMGMSADRSTPAKSDKEFRTYAKEAPKPSSPIMKGSASYARPDAEPDRENATRSLASEKREDASRVLGKSGEKNRYVPRSTAAKGALPNHAQPKAVQAPAAPTPPATPPWSHRQAAGPVATPAPYGNAGPGVQAPLAQSQMMPRAKSAAVMPRTGPAPTLNLPEPAAEPYGAPAPNDAPTMGVPTVPRIELDMVQKGAKPEPGVQKKMPQKPQPTYSGYGMAAGMGGGQAASPPSPPKGAPGMSSGQVSELFERRTPPLPQNPYGEGGGMGGNMMGSYDMKAGQPQGQAPALDAPSTDAYVKDEMRRRGGEMMGGRGLPREQAEGEEAMYGFSRGTPLYRRSESEKVPEPPPSTGQGLAGAYNDGVQTFQFTEGFAGRPMTPGTEQYAPVVENSFKSPVNEPESTVSADVDTASYANVRRFLENNQAPPPGAVRVEEMVNYFDYDYPQPKDDTPFSVDMETASCPWNESNRLVRIGLKAKDIDPAERGPSNLVFLLDVSGSMRDANKLPLVKDAMAMLVDQLTEDDRVSIVTYAGEAGLALEPTEGTKRKEIMDRIEALKAGGSTHGSAGIQMAYDQAMANFVPDGNNRVILCTDGDLNVGITDDNELVKLIQEKASGGVFLTVVGFGTGNLKDAKLEQLADKGNGKYAYVDGLSEAKKVFVEQASGSLVTVAKDVKIQIEFNPAKIQSYRLIGYENRLLAAQDFDDDMKDAGEIGAGHSVTFLYEVVPTNLPVGQIAALNNTQNNLRYQQIITNSLTEQAESGELLALKLRYKLPDEQQSHLLEFPVMDSGKRFGEASSEFRFAASVAAFGMLLRGSQYNQGLTFSAIEEFAAGAADKDPHGHRNEFVDLVRRARSLYGDTTQVTADSIAVPRAATKPEPEADSPVPDGEMEELP